MVCTLLLLLLPIGAAVGSTEPSDGRHAADPDVVLIHGGTIHTWFPRGEGAEDVDESAARASALLVVDGRILAVGDDATVNQDERARNATRIDLDGAHAYPGFQHAHGHLEDCGAAMEGLDLSSSKSIEEALESTEDYARTVPAGEWIIGHGLDDRAWGNGDVATLRAGLSARVPSHPVVLLRGCGSALIANVIAHEAASLDGDHPRGWTTWKHARFAALKAAIPSPSPEVRRRRILRGQEALLQLGYTCVHAMRPSPSDVALLHSLRDEGALRIRVVCYVDANGLESSHDFESIEQPDDPRDVLRVAGVIFRVDGPVLPRTAWLIDEYAEGEGLVDAPPARLDQRALYAARAGLQPVFFATGDRAVRTSLDAIERIAAAGLPLPVVRPRIERVGLIAPHDLRRLSGLAVYPSISVESAVSRDPTASDGVALVRALGEARALRARAWNGLDRSSGPKLLLGPAPFGPGAHPFTVIRAATHGTSSADSDKGPGLSVPRVLFAMTAGSAHATAQEDRRGRLARGYLCDLTIANVDLTELGDSNLDVLDESQILMTVVNGQIVMDQR